ncbi:barstar family protein [Paenibacillus thiaminolyticus]|uniref:barstar family protein n=1 Tax=Paenibacillus thiaminolyticus TaxID=49283 RepID=UPI0023508359|nr:barstar family protein [Paenibacillus thiaminolyticus]WCR25469.1 barstar family protein [Paenibacillus thiaminolyticus]
MDFKFSLLDDGSELIIGYCNDIAGLDGSGYINESSKHRILLKQFIFCNEFKEYIVRRKESFCRLVYICIVDRNKDILANFSFAIDDNIYYHKAGFPSSPTDLSLIGSLESIVSNEDLGIWELWRNSPPSKINEWAKLNENGRRAWLKVVTKYNLNKVFLDSKETKEETFYLDGAHIRDYASFFCALGESINGPGGYFGFDFNSLIDCLHGGYGAVSPFTLIWTNYKVAEHCLDVQAWEKEIKYRSNEYSGEEPFFEERGNRPLFQALVENLKNEGINIIFEQ